MTNPVREAALSLRLWRRDRRRDRAAKAVVKQVGWYVSARDWTPYPKRGVGEGCPYCGSKVVAVRCENWTNTETGDIFGLDLHWCNNNHMWVREVVV